MKNKYQYILDQISGIQNEEFDLLQELVDKETPMKVTNKITCPICDTYAQRVYGSYPNLTHIRSKRCLNDECNQKLDWSKE